MKLLATGGAGHVGSAIKCYLTPGACGEVVTIRTLADLVDPDSLYNIAGYTRYCLEQASNCFQSVEWRNLPVYRPRAVLHFYADAHVQPSAEVLFPFMQTSVLDTSVLHKGPALERPDNIAHDEDMIASVCDKATCTAVTLLA